MGTRRIYLLHNGRGITCVTPNYRYSIIGYLRKIRGWTISLTFLLRISSFVIDTIISNWTSCRTITHIRIHAIGLGLACNGGYRRRAFQKQMPLIGKNAITCNSLLISPCIRLHCKLVQFSNNIENVNIWFIQRVNELVNSQWRHAAHSSDLETHDSLVYSLNCSPLGLITYRTQIPKNTPI